MKSPKFSIAIPAYKSSFLQECIQSVLDQSFADFELIIINDNSPNNLEPIINNFSDSRIKYKKLNPGNGGLNVSHTWNQCLQFAQGEFFMCIGDDDRLLPDCLLKYSGLITEYPALNVFHAGTQLINEKGIVIDLQESRPIFESVWSMIWHRWFRDRKTYLGDFLFKTGELKAMGGGFLFYPYAWGSDEITVYSIASHGGIANMQDFGFQYRVHSASISGANNLYKDKADA